MADEQNERIIKNDIIKIYEDCIKIQQHDVDDNLKSIDNENTKSYYVFIIAGVIINYLLSLSQIRENVLILLALILITLSIVISLYNILSKKVYSQINIDEIFVLDNYSDWKGYLKHKHLTLRTNYDSTKRLLSIKSYINYISYGLLVLSLILIIIERIFRNG